MGNYNEKTENMRYINANIIENSINEVNEEITRNIDENRIDEFIEDNSFNEDTIEKVTEKIRFPNEELEEDRFKKTLRENSQLFNEEIMFARNYERNIIEVENHSPLKCRNYPIPYQFKEAVEKKIQQLLQQDIIERSHSYFISPVVIVKKSNCQ